MNIKTLFLFLLPVLSAGIGWMTIKLLFKSLFYPRQPVRILGFALQGVFPKKQAQIARQLGRWVATELSPFRNLTSLMSDPGTIKALMPGIETHIDGFLNERIKEKIPMLAMFLSDGVTAMIKTGLLEEIEVMLPKVIAEYAGSLEQKIDLERLVTEKVAALSLDKVETALLSGAGKALRHVELAAAGFGFVIGLIQLAMVLA
ncbi:MAG: hypothetical protein EOP52_12075 [Sphingobacteriales bacterium]|nr:MAG: hypothetical protein EOP52_12075 [Sphingobacteriales bacterium]